MRFNHDKKLLLGAWLWISSVQYFIVQLIVISAWTVPYSFANNYISDLGNTDCGTYDGLMVCSPLWPLMNVSFVVFGVTMAVGTQLLRSVFVRSRLSTIAFLLMILSGIGTVMVGLFPENTVSGAHTIGAFLGLGVGNLSALLLGVSLSSLPKSVRTYTMISGIVSIAAFILFIYDVYLGLGRGGMERLISYPFTVWMIIFGITMLFTPRVRRP